MPEQTKPVPVEEVTLFPREHRGSEKIFIGFAPSKILDDAVRRIKGVKWSQAYNCWYVPLDKDNYALVCQTLHLMATIRVTFLREYLHKRKSVRNSELPAQEVALARPVVNLVPPPLPQPIAPQPSPAYPLSSENLQSLQQAVKHLVPKGYSYSTIRTYRGESMAFFQVLGKRPASQLTTEDVKRYLLKCVQQGLTENTVHSRINALKFYYDQVLRRERFFVDIPKAEETPAAAKDPW